MTNFSLLLRLLTGRRPVVSAPAGLANWAVLLLVLLPLLGLGQSPAITGFTPTSGQVGTNVVITGTNFTNATGVAFNGTTAPGFVVNSPTQITVPVPAGGTTGPIRVTTAFGTGTSTAGFGLEYWMPSDVSTCSGTLYDPAGPNGNFVSQTYQTTILTPPAAGANVRLTFTQFAMQQAILYIWDGPDDSAPLLYVYNSNNPPGTVTATNPTGQLTVRFRVGNLSGPGDAGFAATISCAPKPFISSFSPSSGVSGTSVVITGANFTGTTDIYFNGMLTRAFTVNSDAQITVPVPTGATSGPIRVTTATSTGISTTDFVTNNYWMSPAAITTCSGVLYDPSGPEPYYGINRTTTLTPATAGGKVRLTFAAQYDVDATSALTIYDGPGTNAPLIGNYTTTNPGIVTASSATGQLTVRFRSGPYTQHTGFEAAISCALGTPTVSSFTPTSAGQGASVVITGTNFTNATGVTFNGVPAPGFVVNSPTQITVPVPAGTTVGRITVSTANGPGSSATDFTPLPPVISSFTPTSGVAGTSVVITGVTFTGTTAVRFNGVLAPGFVVNSPTQITVSVPAGTTTGPITVTNSLGTATSAPFATDVILIGTSIVTTCSGSIYDSGGPNNPYGSNDNLTTTISPATAGAKVRLSFSQIDISSGTDSNYLLIYDGPDATAPQIGSLTIYNNGGSVVVTATNPTGKLTLRFASIANYGSGGFAGAISCVVPTLSSFTPGSGQAGTSVVLTGTEFATASAVRFNGVLAPGFVVNSDTQITVSVPAGASSGLISVTTSYGTATSATSFVVPQPALTAVSPFLGVPGTVLTLTGTNLGGTSAITFFGGAGVRTVTSGFVVNAAGTQITGIVVPAGAQSGPLTATTGSGTSPVASASFARARTLAAGSSHTVAVRTDGSLWVWGNNADGQLGLGSTGGQQASPVRVGSDNNWASVAAGGSHTVALKTDGSLWAWGNNASGQLGLSNNTSQNTPERVGLDNNWASVAAGSAHTVAVRSDNTLYAWGLNDNGQLGLTNLANQNAPQLVGPNWASAAAGSTHTVAVKADGSLWAWGSNASGQLGIGNTTAKSAPQQVGNGTNWASAAAGSAHTLATRADGSLWAWGSNASSQLGLGANTANQNTPQPVGNGTNWLSAAAGDAHSLAVQANGSLWAWGLNANGQLGLGTTTSQTTPQAVAAVTSWASATAGTGYSAGEQACGASWAWGLNTNGQVGDGSTTQRPSPVLIFNPISLLTFSPTTAGPSSTVTVTGTNLAGLTALTVNGVNALTSVTNSTATGFTFVVPASTPLGAGTVALAAGCGTGSSTAFTVGVPTPILNAVSPAAELPGQAVVLTGLNFTSASTVSFGGVPAASVTYTSPTSLTAVVPVAATPGGSAIVVGTATGTNPNSPAFEVLQVYRGTAASGCLATATASVTGTGGANTWRYLRLPGAGGAVVAAIEDTRNLGTVSASLLALGTATAAPVRNDGNGRAYLDRNFALTATNKTFAGQAVRVRFFGLASELTRLTAVDATAALATLNASQYSGFYENCDPLDNDPAGERRLLPAPATMLSGADWFTAQVSVADHFSEFYLTAAGTPLQAATQAPLLTAVSPARNLPTALQAANVGLTFSQPMAAGTAGNVRVFGSQSGGQLVRGGNATTSGNTITVDPARPFAPGERVLVTVPATVQSTGGYNAVPNVYEFTAEAGRGPATFLDAPTVLTVGGNPGSVAMGDVNGDGLPDLISADSYGRSPGYNSSIEVRLRLGNGQFDVLRRYQVPRPATLTLGDVDGDGDLDIMATTAISPNEYIITLMNDGQGSFVTTTTRVSAGATHEVLGDVDGDGDLDMLTAGSTAGVSFNNGSGAFSYTANAINPATGAVDVALNDVDGDGDLDALLANGSQVSVRLNNGTGTFSGGSDVPMGSPTTKLTVGDVDGDGDLDLTTTSANGSQVSVRLNNGNGTFGGGANYPMPFVPGTLALGDVNGDGNLDLVVAGNIAGANSPYGTPILQGRVAVRLNTGNGTFGGSSSFATGGSDANVALADADGDGTLDLLTSHAGYMTGTTGYPDYKFVYTQNELYIRYNKASAPTIAGFSPQSGPAGTPVTITGTNLHRVRGVRFGGSSELALFTAQSVNSLTVLVPVGAASGTLTLTSAQGASLATATPFTYTPRPAGLLATLSTAGPLDACAPRTLTATAASPAFATGAGLTSTSTNTGITVNSMAARPNGQLLIGGPFLSYDGALVNRIVQLNPDGSRDAGFLTGLGFDGTVNALALQPDGKALMGGSFGTFDGTAPARLVRLNANGTRDATFDIGSGLGSGAVQAIVVQPDGQVLVGGSLPIYNGVAQNNIIRLNPDGSPDVGFVTGTGFDATVTNMALQADGKVLVAGQFTSYNTTMNPGNIVRLNADGSYDNSFRPATTGMTVLSIVLQADGKLLVGGTIVANGATKGQVVRLTTTGTLDGNFNTGTGFDAQVTTMALQADGKVLVAGQFTTYKGQAQNRLVLLDANGALDATFNIGTGFDERVRRLLVQADGSVVVGGNYSSFNGSPATRLIRLRPNGTANTMPTPVSGASFTFTPGNSTTSGALVTSTPGTYTAVASLNGETSASSNAITLTTCASVLPTVTALSVPAELPGLPVTITGTGFAPGSTVDIGGVAATVTYVSPTTLTALVPMGAAPGLSSVLVTTGGISSVGGAAFTVLAVYDGGTLDACAPAVPATASLNDGAWHYLLAGNGQVVAAYNYTGASLGSLSVDVLRANPAQPVRQDAGNRAYLDRNFHLTASGGRFDNRTVQLRFYGLTTELTRLRTADGSVSMATLKAMQYSGPNEDCQLANNAATGERRMLPAPATAPAGAPWFAAELTVADHFSEFYLTGSSTPLPVELLSFTAEKRGTTVALAWATASEKNSDRFEVERSRDGRRFERIGQAAAAGSSTSRHAYDFLDAKYPGETDLLYYRLRQVNLDGTASYSPVRTVRVGGPATLALFPNPTQDAATLTGATPGTVVTVFDALGREVLVAKADATGTVALALPRGLPVGVYVVRVGSKALRLTVT